MGNFRSFLDQVDTNTASEDPWKKYKNERGQRFGNINWLIHYSPCILFFIAFIIIFNFSNKNIGERKDKNDQKKIVEIILPTDVEVKISKK